jgi:ABC-2 type transport system ATP-binding protein
VFFLDEPTTGLDPQARRNLWELIKEVRDRGISVILTTHYMDEAEVLCDRIAIMDHGKIIKLDTPKNLIKDLLGRGFKKEQRVEQANLEDVFIDLTGKALRS